jgi:hypothetical protein
MLSQLLGGIKIARSKSGRINRKKIKKRIFFSFLGIMAF